MRQNAASPLLDLTGAKKVKLIIYENQPETKQATKNHETKNELQNVGGEHLVCCQFHFGFGSRSAEHDGQRCGLHDD
jgi:hypothetical protein